MEKLIRLKNYNKECLRLQNKKRYLLIKLKLEELKKEEKEYKKRLQKGKYL